MRFRVFAYQTDDFIHELLKAAFPDVIRLSDLDPKSRPTALNNSRPQALDEGVVVVGGGSLIQERGVEWVKEAKATWPTARIIVLADSLQETPLRKQEVLSAFRWGASDFLEIPTEGQDGSSRRTISDALIHSIKMCFQSLLVERTRSDQLLKFKFRINRCEGKSEEKLWFSSDSEAMRKVNEQLQNLRRNALRGEAESTVLILGAPGAAKEALARRIHIGSRQMRGPWLTLNCANLRSGEFETEVFGYESGEAGNPKELRPGLLEIGEGGTLFLSEITHLTLDMQERLQRVLETGQFHRLGGSTSLKLNVRLILSGSSELSSRVAEGKFRPRLYELVSGTEINIPSLKERSKEIISIATHFAEKAFQEEGKYFEGFTLDAREALLGYSWPGDISELYELMLRAALISSNTSRISMEMLGFRDLGKSNMSLEVRSSTLERINPIDESNREVVTFTDLKKKWSDHFEREFLTSVLNRFQGNVSAAARDMKLDRSNFLRLLRKHGLRSQEYRKAA